MLGNPDAPGYQPNTPGNFDPANPGGLNPQQAPGSGGTIDAGGILQSQMMLATWAAKSQAGQSSSIPGYGKDASDFTGVADTRFTTELASFQTWYDAQKGGTLNTQGVLDTATYQALVQVNGELLAGQTEPGPAAGAGGSSTTTYLLLGAAALAALVVLRKRGGGAKK